MDVNRSVIALLGQRDYPTDGVADYCDWLSTALAKRNESFLVLTMPWGKLGWWRSLQWLWAESQHWQGQWVLLQYTAFAWSRRGFPFVLLLVIALLRQRQVRLGVIFHDTQGFPGQRWIDRLRRGVQEWLMQRIYQLTDLTILTIDLKCVPWLPANPTKAVVIPVGSNVPEPSQPPIRTARPAAEPKTIVVFGITGEPHTGPEVAEIVAAVKGVAEFVPGLRLVACGRGSSEAGDRLRQSLAGVPVEIDVLGLLPAESVAELMATADVLLFVRGNISSGRTSVVAGVAAGLPIVGYAGTHTGFPMTEAGIMLVPPGDRDRLVQDLKQVLTDATVWQQLHQRNLMAQQQYFAWDAIAAKFQQVLYGA